jgi:hypothetical protein
MLSKNQHGTNKPLIDLTNSALGKEINLREKNNLITTIC